MAVQPIAGGSHTVAETTWIRLMRVYHKINKQTADVMRSHGLSVSRFDVLVHAGVSDGRTQQELADAMLVTKGNITQLLDGMEAEKLLYRRRKGRTNHIFLTEEGRAIRDRALADNLRVLDCAMGALDPNEQKQLGLLLRTIDRQLDKQ